MDPIIEESDIREPGVNEQAVRRLCAKVYRCSFCDGMENREPPWPPLDLESAYDLHSTKSTVEILVRPWMIDDDTYKTSVRNNLATDTED